MSVFGGVFDYLTLALRLGVLKSACSWRGLLDMFFLRDATLGDGFKGVEIE